MKRRWLLGGAGCLLMGYAVLGALADPDVNPPGHLAFLAAVLVGHDAVLMPLAIGVGVLLGRFAGRVRTVLQAALFVSAVITFITLPLVLGPGRSADNPSALPKDYGRGLRLVLAAIWLGAAAALALRRFRRASPPTG